MRIHYLNGISTCPLGGALMDGRSYGSLRGRLTCTCMLVDTGSDLVLIDTGLGLRDVVSPHSRLSGFFLALLAPEFREEMTVVRQIERLGYRPQDVGHIVLTHLDFDHAGGLDDFPQATVHLMLAERDYAFAQRTWLDRQRFRPQQWSTRARWRVYAGHSGEPWFGFKAVRDLHGLPPEILLVPLAGHTYGHAGVAVQSDGRWMLNAGDTYFYHREMHPQRPRCTLGLRLYQSMMEKNRSARLWNRQRLRQLAHSHASTVVVFCSHDPHEFERLAGRGTDQPVAVSPDTRLEASRERAHAAAWGTSGPH